MIIRRAEISDSDVLSALCVTVWIDTYCIDGIESAHARHVFAEYANDKIAAKIERNDVFVAEYGELIVGVAFFNAIMGEIETLYVLPRFQGCRAGKLLINTIRRDFVGRIFLTCWEENQKAIDFYKHVGFVESGESCFLLDGKGYRNIELSSSS